jgi:hypothetical protein
MQKNLWLCRFLAFWAESAHFQPHHPDLKTALLGDVFLQFFERRTRVFHDRAALEASHVAVIPIRFGLVVMLLALDVHKIELIDQAAILEKRDRSIDSGPVNARILFLAISSSVAASRCRGES